uniref:Pectinesterase n=1 Tax=Cunninghamia lanceolata TaxID=28977 RepID=A0A6G9W358_CUNLA|nr:pectin methylesterase 9 [Cunninghamia lanceolata]
MFVLCSEFFRSRIERSIMALYKLKPTFFLIYLMFLQIKSDGLAHNALQSACSATLDPKFCMSTLTSFEESSEGGPIDLGRIALNVSIAEARKVFDLIARLGRWAFTGRQLIAFEDCLELFDITLDNLERSMSKVNNSNSNYLDWRQSLDVQTWLSSALTNQATCLQGFQETSGNQQSTVSNSLHNVSRLLSNSLALVKNIPVVGRHHKRRLLSDLPGERENNDGFPSWLSDADRRRLLLQADGIFVDEMVTVAGDGSGNYATINDALNAAPNNSQERYVIYVKEGVYQEYIEVPIYKTNIMMVGDGINVTVITGNRNFVDGWTTYSSATVAVVGIGFLARDITFENTAGPEKLQAVALRVVSDLSAFYRCSINGFQDTLYVHSFRQFYRECDIYGTVDFIFGDAAVVFQTCNIFAKKPMEGQENIITAQARIDFNENTGISIQNCTIAAAPDLASEKSLRPTYLGRPWREFSRTVYIKSYIDDVVQPAGWAEWSGDFGLSTLYYGEYLNWGPGAGTAQRVQWPGYHVMDFSDAQFFTVTNLIAGDTWLNTVPFVGGLN